MKKGLTILTALFLTLSLASCGDKSQNSSISSGQTSSSSNEHNSSNSSSNSSNSSSHDSSNSSDSNENSSSSNKPGHNSQEVNSIDIFKESLTVMNNQVYEVRGFGPSNTVALGINSTLHIYEDLKHKQNELYFEKVSNGDPVVGQKVSFARKVYMNGNDAKRTDSETKEPWDLSSDNFPIVTYSENVSTMTTEQVLNDFGKPKGSYINFVIDNDTVTSSSKTGIFDGEKYTLNFNIDLSNGLNSRGLGGYKNQVNTMSGKELKSVESISLEIILDKNYKVIEYTSKENYVVSAIGKLTANVSNNLNYKFKYFENSDDLVIKTF